MRNAAPRAIGYRFVQVFSRLFFPASGFVVFLHRESYLYLFRRTISRLGCSRYIPATVAYHAFLLLSAALWLRSSPRLYQWLLNHKRLGPYISDFLEHKAIPLRVKVISVSLVWITLLYCALFVARVWWLALLFVLLAVALSWHILSYKTRK